MYNGGKIVLIKFASECLNNYRLTAFHERNKTDILGAHSLHLHSIYSCTCRAFISCQVLSESGEFGEDILTLVII